MEKQEEAARQLVDAVRSSATYKLALAKDILTCLDTGDGMALVFEGDPTTPAFAALDIVSCRGAQPPHPVRMGLHSGPAMRVRDINDRQNFKGVGINIAQRVMDCGDSGQIMMTEHYASILRSYNGWSNIIVSRGLRTVKHGVKLRICELVHEHARTTSLSAKLQKPLPAVPGTFKWTGIFVLMTLVVAGWWAYAMSIIPAASGTDREAMSLGYRNSTTPPSKLATPDIGPRGERQ